MAFSSEKAWSIVCGIVNKGIKTKGYKSMMNATSTITPTLAAGQASV
jgi:hypothetical protein